MFLINRMKNKTVLIVLVSIIFMSCYPTYPKKTIEEYLHPYWEGLNNRHSIPNGVVYSQEYNELLNDEIWRKNIDNAFNQFGSIENTILIGLSTTKFIAGKASGTKYIARFRIERNQGITYEEIQMFESDSSKGVLRITNHIIEDNIRSIISR